MLEEFPCERRRARGDSGALVVCDLCGFFSVQCRQCSSPGKKSDHLLKDFFALLEGSDIISPEVELFSLAMDLNGVL